MARKIYHVNELFYSVQAEGENVGRAAVFVRLAGCNLKCPFCDTDHVPFERMTGEDIENRVNELDPTGCAIVVFTGGEPTMQLTDDEELCRCRFRAMETNGILPAPKWMDWVTMSPKTELGEDRLKDASEIKILLGHFPKTYVENLIAFVAVAKTPAYVQPIADEAGKFDPFPCIEFVKKHPMWRVSLQWHKMFGVR